MSSPGLNLSKLITENKQLQLNDMATTAGAMEPASASLLPVPALLLSLPGMLVVIVVSVGGNVMVLMSYKHRSPFVDANTLYLLNLAVSDLLISVLCMPLHLVSTLFSSCWPLGRAMCKVYTAAQLMLLNVTTLILVLVAVDGLVQARDGVRSTGAEAKKKAYVLLTTCWLMAAFVHVPETMSRDVVRGFSLVPDNLCKPEFYRSLGHVLFMQVWDFFLPVLVLSVVNTRLYFRLRRASLTILAFRHFSHSRPENAERQTSSLEIKTHDIRRLPDVKLAVKLNGDINDSVANFLQPSDECTEGKSAAKAGMPTEHVKDTHEKNQSESEDNTSTWSLILGQRGGRGKATNHAGKRLDEDVATQRERKRRAGRHQHDHKDHHHPAVDHKAISTCASATSQAELAAECLKETGPLDCESKDARPRQVLLDTPYRLKPKCLTKSGPQDCEDQEARPRQVLLDTPYRLKRVAVILFMMVLILVLCWLPYSLAFIVSSVCDDCVHPAVNGLLVWLLYFKSCINPFLYAYNTFAFRSRFRHLLARVVPTKRFRRMTTDRVSKERASILN